MRFLRGDTGAFVGNPAAFGGLYCIPEEGVALVNLLRDGLGALALLLRPPVDEAPGALSRHWGGEGRAPALVDVSDICMDMGGDRTGPG